jgi:acyl-coenzyme A synthetase/AMP-(fatty) acid ligase
MNPISTLFAQSGQQNSQPALVHADFSMTHDHVTDTVKRIATKLEQSGVSHGSIVGLRIRPEIEALFTLAVMQLGATSLHASEVVVDGYSEHMDLLCTDDEFVRSSSPSRLLVDLDFIQSLASVQPREECVDFSEHDVCRIVFSSGSTGTPRGIPFTVGYLTERVDSAEQNWIPSTPFMSLLGLDTVSGFLTFMWAMTTGETFFISGDAATNVRTISEHSISAIKTSPAKLNDLLDHVERRTQVAPSLHTVEVLGSLLTARTIERCQKTLNTMPLYLYGSSEVGTVSKGAVKVDQPENVGTLVSDITAETLGDDGLPTRPRTLGRLRFRKKSMPVGYWNENSPKPDQGFHEGWFYSGDIATITLDNELILHGRSDDLVNAGGTKFTLQQLDAWLQNIDSFMDAASAQFSDDNGDTKIAVAFVSANPIGLDAVMSQLNRFLPSLPIGAIIRLAEIERNPVGKVNRTAILSKLYQPERVT